MIKEIQTEVFDMLANSDTRISSNFKENTIIKCGTIPRVLIVKATEHPKAKFLHFSLGCLTETHGKTLLLKAVHSWPITVRQRAGVKLESLSPLSRPSPQTTSRWYWGYRGRSLIDSPGICWALLPTDLVRAQFLGANQWQTDWISYLLHGKTCIPDTVNMTKSTWPRQPQILWCRIYYLLSC